MGGAPLMATGLSTLLIFSSRTGRGGDGRRGHHLMVGSAIGPIIGGWLDHRWPLEFFRINILPASRSISLLFTFMKRPAWTDIL